MFHNTSALLKVITAIIIAGALGFSFFLFAENDEPVSTPATSTSEQSDQDTEGSPETEEADENIVTLSDGTRVYVGEEVNSESEYMNDLLARFKTQDEEVARLRNEVANLRSTNQTQQALTPTTTDNSKVDNYLGKVDELQKTVINKIKTMEQEIADLNKGGKSAPPQQTSDTTIVDQSDLPIGVTSGKFANNNPKTPNLIDPDKVQDDSSGTTKIEYDENQWVYPLNTTFEVDKKSGKTVASVPNFDKDGSTRLDSSSTASPTQDSETKEPKLIPMATIPDGATLLKSRTLTALIGRVPVGKQVIDPYPFKLVVGKENLASNYKSIPGIDGITVQGKTRGNRTLQCVFADVTKITFTFTDGRVTTLPKQKGQASNRASLPSIGYLSDDQGVPCISGININNRTEYITQKVGLDAFQAAARALADNERTRITGSNETVTETVTGDGGKVIFGETLAAGAESGAAIASDFMNEAFEGIYVPNNRLVTLHIESELAIDYDPQGRKLFYDNPIPSSGSFSNTGRL